MAGDQKLGEEALDVQNGLCPEKWGRFGLQDTAQQESSVTRGDRTRVRAGASQTVGAARVARKEGTGKEESCSVLGMVPPRTSSLCGLKGTFFNSILEIQKPEGPGSGPTHHVTLHRTLKLFALHFSHL